jgi:4-amino-4-deoxy-L-arabinose transferase-like glycosyltransferase
MVVLVIWSAYLAYRWGEEKSWPWAIATGLLSGLAVLIKAPAAFQVGLLLAFTVLTAWGIKRAVRDVQVWLVAAFAIAIPAVFYLFLKEGGSGGYLEFWSASFTKMILEPGFYVRWLVFLEQNVVEVGLFFAGLAGATLFSARGRAIALGLWLGYGIYGLVLPYLISTHDYYSLPLIPAIAFSLAPFASPIRQAVSRQPRLWQGVFYAVLVLTLAYPAWIARSALLGSDYRQEILGWQAMGEELPSDKPILAIIHDYGHRLRYYGWTAVDLWPSTADQKLSNLRNESSEDLAAMFARLTEGYEYFLVTQPKELQAQPELAEILYNHYPLLIDQDGYLLFDLTPEP